MEMIRISEEFESSSIVNRFAVLELFLATFELPAALNFFCAFRGYLLQ